MPLINDPNVTSQIAAIAQGTTINTEDLLAIINAALPAGQQIQSTAELASGIYKRFNEFDKVNAKVEVVTTGLWSGDVSTLTSFYTASSQVTNTGNYYYNVYNAHPVNDSSAEVQFAVAYGHYYGSGSVSLANNANSLLSTKANYAQYKSTLLDPGDDKFSFENASGISVDSNAIYAVNVSRARYREKMDAGNWSINISGSNGLFTFIDDSGQKFSDTSGRSGRVFKVVSGSLNLGTASDATIATATASNGLGYGLVYPDRGIIVFNPDAIGDTVGDVYIPEDATFQSVSGSLNVDAEQQNHRKLFEAISQGAGFQSRRTENISTQHFFVRATNREFNYSNNPTYYNSDGTFVQSTFESDPKTYITTVGLYNDSNELIAVAKTSQPIPKSFDREVLIKIKLSY